MPSQVYAILLFNISQLFRDNHLFDNTLPFEDFFFYKVIPMNNYESLIMESRDVKEASVEGVQRRTNPKKHFVSFC